MKAQEAYPRAAEIYLQNECRVWLHSKRGFVEFLGTDKWNENVYGIGRVPDGVALRQGVMYILEFKSDTEWRSTWTEIQIDEHGRIKDSDLMVAARKRVKAKLASLGSGYQISDVEFGAIFDGQVPDYLDRLDSWFPPEGVPNVQPTRGGVAAPDAWAADLKKAFDIWRWCYNGPINIGNGMQAFNFDLGQCTKLSQ